MGYKVLKVYINDRKVVRSTTRHTRIFTHKTFNMKIYIDLALEECKLFKLTTFIGIFMAQDNNFRIPVQNTCV